MEELHDDRHLSNWDMIPVEAFFAPPSIHVHVLRFWDNLEQLRSESEQYFASCAAMALSLWVKTCSCGPIFHQARSELRFLDFLQ